MFEILYITVMLAAVHAICIYQKQYSRLVYTAVY